MCGCVLALALAAAAAADEPPAASPARPLRVGVFPIDGAVAWQGAEPTGVMVEIWRDLARRVGVTQEFVRLPSFTALLEATEHGTVDVGLGPVAITEARERLLDLTHPIIHSGMRIAVRQRNDTGFLAALRSLVSWDLLILLAALLALVIAAGHLLWLCERRRNERSFPRDWPRGAWEATWWVASTLLTGGCDDKHVDTATGRALAYACMIAGIVLVTGFTSVVTATLTAERVTGAINGPRDLADRVVGCQESSVAVTAVRQRGGVPREFAAMHEALAALDRGTVEAVVSENQSLMHLVSRTGRPLRLVGPLFDEFDYGLALPNGSPLREGLNTAILRMREDGTLDRLRNEWLGHHD